MTQQQIDDLNAAHAERLSLGARIEAMRTAIDEKIRRLGAQCDHKYPDGRSAIVSGMFMVECLICCWNDM